MDKKKLNQFQNFIESKFKSIFKVSLDKYERKVSILPSLPPLLSRTSPEKDAKRFRQDKEKIIELQNRIIRTFKLSIKPNNELYPTSDIFKELESRLNHCLSHGMKHCVDTYISFLTLSDVVYEYATNLKHMMTLIQLQQYSTNTMVINIVSDVFHNTAQDTFFSENPIRRRDADSHLW